MKCTFVLVVCSLMTASKRRCDGAFFLEQTDDTGLVTTVLQMMHHHFSGCHIVLATSNSHFQNFSYMITEMAKEGNETMVLLDEASVPSTPRAAANPAFSQKRKESGLWREAQATCRMLLLDFSNSNAIFVSRVLEWAAIWTQPDTRLVGMGENVGVMTLLLHPGLRNTRYALYVTKQIPGKYESKKEDAGVEVWRRCVYCEDGEAGVERLGRWNETKPGIPGHPSLFRDRYENYNRHKFRLLEKNFFPYLKFERLSDDPGSLVRHRDAFGTRVIQAMSNSLNFTYEVREPVDGHWGLEAEKGNWTGIVGQLQRGEGDICLDLTVTPQRCSVIQYTGAYTHQLAVLFTTKPRPLPEYLSLVRPFEC